MNSENGLEEEEGTVVGAVDLLESVELNVLTIDEVSVEEVEFAEFVELAALAFCRARLLTRGVSVGGGSPAVEVGRAPGELG